jgi:preprotein translocase subunit SecF
MMQLIPPNTNFDFVGRRHVLVGISLGLIALSILLVLVRGPKLGIDFAGGSLVHVRFAAVTETDAVRKALGSTLAAVDIQNVGREQTEFLIRLPLTGEESESVNTKVTTALAQSFGKDQVEILRVEAVGPRVGEALRQKAILAVVFATLMMGVYIWIRFEWRFGVGAAVALFHDVVLTTSALVLFGYEFDLTIVAALLTVVGFSVNDTVIVSDRIRENRSKDRRAPLAEIVNRSINQTLSRTILTTGTAVLVVSTLYLLGGAVIHGFAFALLVGFLVGTYSSIFIASPIVLFFEPKAAVSPREGRAPARPAPRRT